MALIPCLECNAQVSDKAPVCVHCGVPIAGNRAAAPVEARPQNDLIAVISAVVSFSTLALAFALVLLRPEPATNAVAATEKAPPPNASANRWIRVDPVRTDPGGKPWLLGLDTDAASVTIRGFRPSRKIGAPSAPYEIQQHEVTWGELQPWLMANAAYSFSPPPRLPDEQAKRDRLPATGVPWATADAYCKAINGMLPSEEQWEYAARGADRRRYPWGIDNVDPDGTHAFAGTDGKPVPVMTSAQDHTPGDENAIFDLLGNAREWTSDAYRDELSELAPAWATRDDMTFRVVRGFPLFAPAVAAAAVADSGLAYREHVCVKGPCIKNGQATQEDIVMTIVAPDPKRDQIKLWDVFRQWLRSSEATVAATECLRDDISSPLGFPGIVLKVFANPRQACFHTESGQWGLEDWYSGCRFNPGLYHWGLEPVRPAVDLESVAGAGDSNVKACAERLNKLLAVLKPQGSPAWATSIGLIRVAPQVASKFYDIGFRCVRPVEGG